MREFKEAANFSHCNFHYVTLIYPIMSYFISGLISTITAHSIYKTTELSITSIILPCFTEGAPSKSIFIVPDDGF